MCSVLVKPVRALRPLNMRRVSQSSRPYQSEPGRLPQLLVDPVLPSSGYDESVKAGRYAAIVPVVVSILHLYERYVTLRHVEKRLYTPPRFLPKVRGFHVVRSPNLYNKW